MGEGPLLVERRGAVTVLRLNRPRVLNALDEALVLALLDAVRAAGRERETRCLVVTGAGRAFCAGGDLTAMLEMVERRDRGRFGAYVRSLMELSAALRAIPQPSIAAIGGYALAGGFELALMCDLRIAATDAVFGLPDTPLGLSPTSGMTYLLPRVVGLGWAKHLTLTAEQIDAATAERIGLVTRVVAPSELEETALALAATLAASPPLALAQVKHGFDAALDAEFAATLARETEAELACFDTEEFGVNLRRFAERRRSARADP